jgi:hypothetical protein
MRTFRRGYFIGIRELCELLRPGLPVRVLVLVPVRRSRPNRYGDHRQCDRGAIDDSGIFLLPGIAVGVRRLHDVDRSGWWLLLAFIPLVGTIILIVWFCTRGTPGPNRFGPDPLSGIGQITPRPIA